MSKKQKADYFVNIPTLNDAQIGFFYKKKSLRKWLLGMGLKEKAEELNGQYTNAISMGVEDKDGRFWFVAWIPKDVSIFTIAHECLHLSWFLLDFKGVCVGADNHEVLAYLQAYLSKQVALKLGLVEQQP